MAHCVGGSKYNITFIGDLQITFRVSNFGTTKFAMLIVTHVWNLSKINIVGNLSIKNGQNHASFCKGYALSQNQKHPFVNATKEMKKHYDPIN
jgi:hypothetical protein